MIPIQDLTMHDCAAPRIAKWPFCAADLLLLAGAWMTYAKSALPLGPVQIGIGALLIVAGAAAAVMPFVLEYRALVRLMEASQVAAAVPQLQGLEAVAAQIGGATSRWQTAQDAAEKTSAAAREIADQMAARVEDFKAFIEHINDSEKATLRVEVEKLRRAEGEWLQVLVRTLDHIYALHQGAVRSGQPGLIEQLGNFQNACREIARRIGLVPLVALQAEKFDAQRHQLADGGPVAENGAVIAETIATGYTFQGRLVRPALVRLAGAEAISEPVGTALSDSKPDPAD